MKSEQTEKTGIWRVIGASSAGTMIEWYDFYIFGSLAAIISSQFYPEGNATVNFLKTLATFAVGFAVRPSEHSFGRLGDLVGRSLPSSSSSHHGRVDSAIDCFRLSTIVSSANPPRHPALIRSAPAASTESCGVFAGTHQITRAVSRAHPTPRLRTSSLL